MRTTKRIARAIAVAGTSVVLLMGMPAPAAHAATYQGCPDGWVCLYPQDTGWNGGRPSHKWYYYGSYNLSNQFGTHRFFNNQTGGAKAWTCLNYGGTNCPTYQPAGSWWDYNFTPINSVKLTA
jgi:hypothetical protein